jgi:hypothetical protein
LPLPTLKTAFTAAAAAIAVAATASKRMDKDTADELEA